MHVSVCACVSRLGRGKLRSAGAHHSTLSDVFGIELDSPNGEHDGAVDGHRYFTCTPGYGVIVRISWKEGGKEKREGR